MRVEEDEWGEMKRCTANGMLCQEHKWDEWWLTMGMHICTDCRLERRCWERDSWQFYKTEKKCPDCEKAGTGVQKTN